MYKVIVHFCDLKDNNHPYNVGDTFPRKGCTYPVSEDRCAELAGTNNKRGVALIEKVEEKPVEEAPVEEVAAEDAPKVEEKPAKKPAAKKGK